MEVVKIVETKFLTFGKYLKNFYLNLNTVSRDKNSCIIKSTISYKKQQYQKIKFGTT